MVSGEVPGLLGTHSPTFAPYGGFRTADGWVVLAGAGSEDLWVRCCRVLGLDELAADLRFADNAPRVAHRDELTKLFEEVLTAKPSAHWLSCSPRRRAGRGGPGRGAGPVAGPSPPRSAPCRSWSTPTAGAYRLIGPPLRIDRDALPYPAPAPALGADTRAVLAASGMAPADIDRLVAGGVAVAP